MLESCGCPHELLHSWGPPTPSCPGLIHKKKQTLGKFHFGQPYPCSPLAQVMRISPSAWSPKLILWISPFLAFTSIFQQKLGVAKSLCFRDVLWRAHPCELCAPRPLHRSLHWRNQTRAILTPIAPTCPSMFSTDLNEARQQTQPQTQFTSTHVMERKTS